MTERELRIVEAVRAHTFSALTSNEHRDLFLQRGYAAEWDAYCCVAATRVAYDVLREFCIFSKPMKVMTRFFNKAAWDWSEAGCEGAAPEGALMRYTGTPEGQATAARDMLNGHAVLIVENEFLLDCSAEQFATPDAGLEMESVAIDLRNDLGRAFLRDEEAPLFLRNAENGSVFIYLHHPDLSGLYDAPDWHADYADRLIVTERVKQAAERAQAATPSPS